MRIFLEFFNRKNQNNNKNNEFIRLYTTLQKVIITKKKNIVQKNNLLAHYMVYIKNQYILYNMEINSIASIFAKNVIKYRKRKGLSQYELADLSGISRAMISHYEREGMFPPAERLQALANSLDIPVYKLYKQAEKEENPEMDFSGIDPRSIKKFKDILSLPPDDRNDLYRILNKMLRKNQLEKEQKK
ncbi:MAG: XRE family transcriptional regulator [Treponema sp.]|nr:XRE family transcriptional regulator [Treponema sp.]